LGSEWGKGAHDLPLRQGKQQLPEHRVRRHLLVRQRSVHAGVEVVVVEIVPQNLARNVMIQIRKHKRHVSKIMKQKL